MDLRSGRTTSSSTSQREDLRAFRVDQKSRRRAKLTRENLRRHAERFAKGHELSDMPRRKSVLSTSTRTTTTDRNFPRRLGLCGVRFDRPTTAPRDIHELTAYLERQRESPSPDSDDHKHYMRQVDRAGNESTMQCMAWPLLSKYPRDKTGMSGYGGACNFEWTECDNVFTDGGLSNPKPDYTESLGFTDYDAASQEQLGNVLSLTVYEHALPNLAVEFKGPDGSMAQAKHQSAYNGATITEACYQIHYHQSKSSEDFYGMTQAITLAYNGATVDVFADHATAGKNGALEYHHHQIAQLITNSHDHFKRAYRYVRNCQDWARSRAVTIRDDLANHHTTKGNVDAPVAQQPLATPSASASPSKKRQGKGRTEIQGPK